MGGKNGLWKATFGGAAHVVGIGAPSFPERDGSFETSCFFWHKEDDLPTARPLRKALHFNAEGNFGRGQAQITNTQRDLLHMEPFLSPSAARSSRISLC